MFSHVMIGANDIDTSKAFYDATLAALGHAPGTIDPKGRCFYVTETGVFALTKPINGESSSHGNGTTVGFSAANEEQALAWHAAGLANGGVTCEELPGYRESPMGPLFLGYLRDPAGNKICVLYRPK
ncbi:VOC family protein [Shewanella sp. 1_MG-2023]|uniref:VOC family protein n=1 Tax=unclassified Shewanella TaxID=196818 RepID=UPI000C836CF7|nr:MULTISPECIES: VOC family protein [unclassified Shewanella]MCC4832722.1 VOC family protein [Shewanella sp. 10N.7]MDO6610408.1 VOC family protein [Shewanella sp. 7_MG-2023]MDO6770533.1 VOC family protein [Shewanella sp. 2_MG-2023]MDO6794420.1 VOC family protein [Shewanella sp. 1_MG-2023]PMG80956.1 glyoxalase [Shewanella sp. 10N.286.51.B7]